MPSPKYCVGDRVMDTGRKNAGTVEHVWRDTVRATYHVRWDAEGRAKPSRTMETEDTLTSWTESDCDCGAKATGQPGHSWKCVSQRQASYQGECNCDPWYGQHAFHCPLWSAF